MQAMQERLVNRVQPKSQMTRRVNEDIDIAYAEEPHLGPILKLPERLLFTPS